MLAYLGCPGKEAVKRVSVCLSKRLEMKLLGCSVWIWFDAYCADGLDSVRVLFNLYSCWCGHRKGIWSGYLPDAVAGQECR